ncbi:MULTISPECIES: hypothetical protein [Photobacterium]|uniref:Lipoprotein n=1 Tax=Photobacterium ganghwense TaxID=320778 RepID=A0A0J1H0B6_9GAMM|nr:MULTISPECIES: hypothetical protein [Photobacterium]KLV05278.1 hypothetical protein ABT57_21735 [Photobacterium ganghwense]MBV1840862.1 hypothetical protein [Photobacterium ganghwense]QSV14814.1 hypothetical protein FH974_04235 [Photobacterium ganghwense]
MKIKPSLILGTVLLAGCANTSSGPGIHANGAIKWANGVTEEMHISASGSSLTFAAPPSLFRSEGIAIFSRIDSARNGNCEHYYSEQAMKTRMQICDNGEVVLIVEGKVANVGAMARYTY